MHLFWDTPHDEVATALAVNSGAFDGQVTMKQVQPSDFGEDDADDCELLKQYKDSVMYEPCFVETSGLGPGAGLRARATRRLDRHLIG